jgi:hypothetical protein
MKNYEMIDFWKKRRTHLINDATIATSHLGIVTSEEAEMPVTPVSDIKGLPHLGTLLPLDELLRLREPQKWILRPIWGLGGHI